MISRTGRHALTALMALAQVPRGQYAGAADIASRTGAPRNYLGKLLKTLAEAGVLESQKGKGGGFRLARDAADVSIFDVVEPIEKVSRWSECFLRGGDCLLKRPCAVHDRWERVRQSYLDFLRETSIADLIASSGQGAAEGG